MVAPEPARVVMSVACSQGRWTHTHIPYQEWWSSHADKGCFCWQLWAPLVSYLRHDVYHQLDMIPIYIALSALPFVHYPLPVVSKAMWCHSIELVWGQQVQHCSGDVHLFLFTLSFLATPEVSLARMTACLEVRLKVTVCVLYNMVQCVQPAPVID